MRFNTPISGSGKASTKTDHKWVDDKWFLPASLTLPKVLYPMYESAITPLLFIT